MIAPGRGNEIQAVKSSILDIADVFVVNKADRAGADRAVLELEQRLELGRVVGAPSAASERSSRAVPRAIANAVSDWRRSGAGTRLIWRTGDSMAASLSDSGDALKWNPQSPRRLLHGP